LCLAMNLIILNLVLHVASLNAFFFRYHKKLIKSPFLVGGF